MLIDPISLYYEEQKDCMCCQVIEGVRPTESWEKKAWVNERYSNGQYEDVWLAILFWSKLTMVHEPYSIYHPRLFLVDKITSPK